MKKIYVMASSSLFYKLLTVQCRTQKGHVVSIISNGTNDAPVPKEADIGLPIGIQGSKVDKEYSDIIILDDNLASTITILRCSGDSSCKEKVETSPEAWKKREAQAKTEHTDPRRAKAKEGFIGKRGRRIKIHVKKKEGEDERDFPINACICGSWLRVGVMSSRSPPALFERHLPPMLRLHLVTISYWASVILESARKQVKPLLLPIMGVSHAKSSEPH
ncbi:hypothetical protein VNO77_38910 [Canavalia gladiata]|uniref:Uncharacterized protein n=1 Tax=Canavalia gladiata TaxID=3824 RepID=A0AAN9PVC5_CANGL